MILIVGSSGSLGSLVTSDLLSKGQKVRLLARTPEKVDDFRKKGAEIIQGDLIDPTSVQKACIGVDKVFAAAHSMLGKGKYKSESVDDKGHRNLIDAAKKAGVSHFVFTSVLGASKNHPIDFFRTKYRIEEYLKNSGLNYTILRPSAFMETHAHLLIGKSILVKGKTNLLGKGNKLRNFIAVKDVSYFASMALMGINLINRELNLGGPGNFTNNDVAEFYGRLANVTPKINHLPLPVVKLFSISLKKFHPGFSRIFYMNSLPNNAYDETFDATSLLSEFDVSLTSLEEFIIERVKEAKQ